MVDESRFLGDWNANKGYLQLMIGYIAMAGEYSMTEDGKSLYKAIRELYKITKGIIDPKISEQAKQDLDLTRPKLWVKNVDSHTSEGISHIQNRYEEAWENLEQIEVSLIGAIHKANLIMPRKEKQKGIKQLWEEYGLDDDNTEEASGDNQAVLSGEPRPPQMG